MFKKGFSQELDAASEDAKKRTVQDVVRSSSSMAALVVLQPLPVIDAALINPILHRMVQAIGQVHGCQANVDVRDGQQIFKTLRGRLITLNAAIAGAKLVPFVPFIGDLVGMSVAYALTWAVGEVSDRYFRSGCTMDKAEMIDTFNAAYKERYEHVYKQKRNELRAIWRAPGVRRQIEQLKQAQREGKLTDDEVERVTEELLNQG